MSAQGRLIVTDEAWQAIVTVLDRSEHQAGSPLQPSDRRCIGSHDNCNPVGHAVA